MFHFRGASVPRGPIAHNYQIDPGSLWMLDGADQTER